MSSSSLRVRSRSRLRHPFSEAILLIAILMALIPIVWLVVSAFNSPREIIGSGWNFEATLGNFISLFSGDPVIIQQIINSVVISVGTLVLCLGIASFSGYSLSQLDWSPRLTYTVLGVSGVIQLIPPMALVPGLYVTLQNLCLLNSVLGLILLNVVFNLPFATVMMKIYFDAVPSAIREAGIMDGASEKRIFFQLQVPLVRAGLAAVGIFVLIMAWNEFLMGLTLTTGGSSAPITVGIANLVQPYAVNYGPMAAIGTLTALPIIAIAIIANRQIVAGLTGGSVK